jgi:hypothetical protein
MHFALWDGHEPLRARGKVLWFEFENSPTGSCVEGLIPKVVLFGEVLKNFACGTWLEEIHCR